MRIAPLGQKISSPTGGFECGEIVTLKVMTDSLGLGIVTRVRQEHNNNNHPQTLIS